MGEFTVSESLIVFGDLTLLLSLKEGQVLIGNGAIAKLYDDQGVLIAKCIIRHSLLARNDKSLPLVVDLVERNDGFDKENIRTLEVADLDGEP